MKGWVEKVPRGSDVCVTGHTLHALCVRVSSTFAEKRAMAPKCAIKMHNRNKKYEWMDVHCTYAKTAFYAS